MFPAYDHLLLAADKGFINFILPEYLFKTALIFWCITAVLTGSIFLFLYIKKKRFFRKQRIEDVLFNWIGEAVVASDEVHIHVTPELLDYFEKERNRQYAIDLLINTKRNITGAAARNIIRLYEQLGLQYDSAGKFRSPVWHVKTKGIYELYMMEQEGWQEELMKLANSPNEYVRNESQTALVSFAGFAGLEFLGSLSQPLDEWQQLKLLEQLKPLDTCAMPDLALWIASPNDSVVLFALKLADIYQQFQVHDEVVTRLDHPSPKIRAQAIKALGNIASEDTAGILSNHYLKEPAANKIIILKHLGHAGSDHDVPFLLEQLGDADHDIRIAAAAALLKLRREDRLLEAVAQDEEKYRPIYNHVKRQLR